MTIQAQVSVYSPVFVPREYDIFAGLDVDHHSIAVTFTDHQRLMQSLRLPYSARQLLNYIGKHFPGQRLAFVYEAACESGGCFSLRFISRQGEAELNCSSALAEVLNNSSSVGTSVAGFFITHIRLPSLSKYIRVSS